KFMPPPPPEKKPAETQQAAAPVAEAPASAPMPARQPVAVKQAASETETVIENDLYRITFTNRGAQVKSWILKKFDNDAQNGPLELMNSAAAARFGYPLSLWTYNNDLDNRLKSALYVSSGESKLSPPATLTFEYADQDLEVRKSLRFDHSYIVN